MGVAERLNAEDLDEPGYLAASHLHRYALAAELSAGRRVLDLACGIGYGTALIGRTAAAVRGIDLDESVVATARAAYGDEDGVSFEAGDALDALERLGADDADVVVMFEALEHVPDPEAVLRELTRLAGDDVALIVSMPNSLAFQERNEFHVTDFGPAEARAAFADLPGVHWLYQHLSEGSLIVGDAPSDATVELASVDSVDHDAANTFIALVGFEDAAVQTVRARHHGVLTPAHNAYMLQLQAANAALMAANRQLARGTYGKFDAAAAAAEVRAQQLDANTQERIGELETRAWILKEERDRFLRERDEIRVALDRERAWADAGRYHAVDIVVSGVKRTPIVSHVARGARWGLRKVRRRGAARMPGR